MNNLKGIVFNIQKFSLHDGPGIRTTVFLKGCPLRCLWCSNPESQNLAIQQMSEKADSLEYTVDEVVEECMQDNDFYLESGGGVTISGGEPFVQYDFLQSLLAKLKEKGVNTAIETTGLVDSDVLMKMLHYIDLVIFDIKHHDSQKHCDGTGVFNERIVENLKLLVKAKKKLLVRIPVIPDFNDSIKDAEGFAELLHGIGVEEVQLLPFHQMGENKYTLLNKDYGMSGVQPLHPEDLEDYLKALQKNGANAFF